MPTMRLRARRSWCKVEAAMATGRPIIPGSANSLGLHLSTFAGCELHHRAELIGIFLVRFLAARRQNASAAAVRRRFSAPGFPAVEQLIRFANESFCLRPGIWNPSHGRGAFDGEIDGLCSTFLWKLS